MVTTKTDARIVAPEDRERVLAPDKSIKAEVSVLIEVIGERAIPLIDVLPMKKLSSCRKSFQKPLHRRWKKLGRARMKFSAFALF